MKNSAVKRGLLISFVMGFMATVPRIIRLSGADFKYLASHLIYVAALSFLYWLASRFFMKTNKNWILNLVAFLFISGLISIIYHRIVVYFFENFSLVYTDAPFMESVPEKLQRIVLFIRGIVFSGLIYFIEYYLNVLSERQRSAIEIEMLKKGKLEAQLDSLKQQISPHFLFNSLSTLRAIVPDENSKQYILQLSNVYRYLLGLNENHLGNLGDELEFIESYLYIQKERFEEALEVSVKIDRNLYNKKLPPLALQLLIENAIKHNVVSPDEPLKIKIFNEGEDLLVVSNKLQPKIPNEISTGKGLENIRTRYELLCGKTISVEKSSDNFTVKLPLLIETETNF